METRVTITAAGHPLAAGLTGNVAVYSSAWRLVWGVPGPGATRVAHVAGMTTRPAIFAYETGAPMLGGAAPAKRVAFFLHENTMDVTTPDGRQTARRRHRLVPGAVADYRKSATSGRPREGLWTGTALRTPNRLWLTRASRLSCGPSARSVGRLIGRVGGRRRFG